MDIYGNKNFCSQCGSSPTRLYYVSNKLDNIDSIHYICQSCRNTQIHSYWCTMDTISESNAVVLANVSLINFVK